jgi:hypothetical protein
VATDRRTDAPVSLVDLMPALCSLFRAPTPPTVQVRAPYQPWFEGSHRVVANGSGPLGEPETVTECWVSRAGKRIACWLIGRFVRIISR